MPLLGKCGKMASRDCLSNTLEETYPGVFTATTFSRRTPAEALPWAACGVPFPCRSTGDAPRLPGLVVGELPPRGSRRAEDGDEQKFEETHSQKGLRRGPAARDHRPEQPSPATLHHGLSPAKGR